MPTTKPETTANELNLDSQFEIDRDILTRVLAYNYLGKKFPKDQLKYYSGEEIPPATKDYDEKLQELKNLGVSEKSKQYKEIEHLKELCENRESKVEDNSDETVSISELPDFFWEKGQKQNTGKVPDFLRIDKVFVIVGAGISSEAGLPLGKQASDDIKKYVVESGRINKEYLENKIESIRLKTGQKKADFETIIEALSENIMTEEAVNDRFEELFGLRNNPVLGYEILAHWLKHRVIDGIINFNFDELLDESIEEEFVHDDYIRLIGGGDFIGPKVDDKVISTDYPLYIKPHGTISDRDSLRSTRDHYVRNTESVQKIFKSVFSGKVLFITVGYAMGSIELNQLFKEQMSSHAYFDPYFYVLSLTSEIENLGNYPSIKRKSIALNAPFRKAKFGSDFLSSLNSNLIQHLNDIYKLNKNKSFKDGVYPLKDIVRHKITYKLFSDIGHIKNEKENKYDIHVYNYLRLLIELSISIAKSGTLIDLYSFNNGRLGSLYEKYYLHTAKEKRLSIREICKKIGLKNLTYAPELMTIIEGSTSPNKFKKKFNKKMKGVISNILDETISLYSEIKKNNRNKFKEKQLRLLSLFQERLKENRNFLEEALKGYAEGSNYEISHPYSSGLSVIHNDDSYKKIYSWYHLKHEILKMTDKLCSHNKGKNTEYQIIYVANYGRYLQDKWVIKNFKRVFDKFEDKVSVKIILSKLPESDFNVKKFLKKLGEEYQEKIEFQHLSWWRNNRNILLFLKKENGKDKDFKPISGIYYYRGYSRNRISPITIYNTDNSNKNEYLNILYRTFKVYYIKCMEQHKNQPITFHNAEGNLDEDINSIFKNAVEYFKRISSEDS